VASSGQNVAVLRMTMTIAPIIGLLIALFVFARHYILTDKKLEEIKNAL
jgi:Na+/melibiose symporter-like transporter